MGHLISTLQMIESSPMTDVFLATQSNTANEGTESAGTATDKTESPNSEDKTSTRKWSLSTQQGIKDPSERDTPTKSRRCRGSIRVIPMTNPINNNLKIYLKIARTLLDKKWTYIKAKGRKISW